MGDIDPILQIFILWGVLGLLGKFARRGKVEGGEKRPPSARPPAEVEAGRRPKPGSFGDLLEQMRAELEQAQQAEQVELPEPVLDDRPGLRPPEQVVREVEPLSSDVAVEDRTSLEEIPTVVSLETVPDRPVRPPSDFMAKAQSAIARRLDEAEEHNVGWRPEDHQQFDAEIRRPTKKRPSRRVMRSGLREAIIWREVLGPPVALKESSND